MWQTILLGIVEGITEFLPISSTGHLILTSRLLNIPQSDFLSSFQIAIQLGAILAVVLLYARSLILEWEILKRVMAAFIPTAVIGLTFYKVIKQYLMGSELVVAWALLIGGVILIIFESFYKEKETSLGEISALSYKQAILIGVFQSFAMVPGVSRSAATIIGGLSLGLKRKTIVEFSFLLAVPTMVAATGLDII
ncbi:MAG: undecaprenyl-diphosphate phosphatase, partial [Candidatus Omnitrophica bacterium]|nr:undecaprenyl-diphosphate phosphatase [Candidatus Omnitrophota bacterium]